MCHEYGEACFRKIKKCVYKMFKYGFVTMSLSQKYQLWNGNTLTPAKKSSGLSGQ